MVKSVRETTIGNFDLSFWRDDQGEYWAELSQLGTYITFHDGNPKLLMGEVFSHIRGELEADIAVLRKIAKEQREAEK